MGDLQSRIVEDLSGVLAGEVHGDPVTLAMYATDASLYEVTPCAVVVPKHRDDILATINYAREHSLPLIPRGSGTGVAGGALGKGIVIDFSVAYNELIADDGDTVTVQAGMRLATLNRLLRRTGRYFAPDPANSLTTTIGSMLAVDAAGSHALRVGSARDHVLELEMLLSDGSSFDATRVNLALISYLDDPSQEIPIDLRMPVYRSHPQLLRSLSTLLSANAELIDKFQPPLMRNASGYFLRNVLQNEVLDLPRMLIGSEGTLGIFSTAKLHVSRQPEHRGMSMFFFDHLSSAATSIKTILSYQPSACDLIDRRLLNLARNDARFAKIIPANAEAAVIVEQEGATRQQMRRRLAEIVRAVRQVSPNASIGYSADDEDDVQFLWSLAGGIVPMLNKIKGDLRPLPFIEDIAIPPDQFESFLNHVQKVFQKHQLTATLYSHAGTGQMHFRPFMQHPALDGGVKMESLARDVYQVVFDHGGTISGEHGNGLARTSFIRSQYAQLYKVFKEVKLLFDPVGMMNPDKIISDDAHLTRKNLRLWREEPEVFDLDLNWRTSSAIEQAQSCNGCGVCRSTSPGMRMCPFFRNSRKEVDAPRSKGNILRQHMQGILNPESMAKEDFQAIVDSCFQCKQCAIECPSEVDIPHLHLEAKARYVAIHGQTRSDWYLSRIHQVGNLATRLPFFANMLLTSQYSRWLMEKLFGLARQRKLPRYQSKTFLRHFTKDMPETLEQMPPDRSVVYFVDYYANQHDPFIGIALMRLLTSLNINILIPPEQTISGMGYLAAGDFGAARNVADVNLRLLGEYAREGYSIICTEPSAAIALKQEYPFLSTHPDVNDVANKTIDAGQYLWNLILNESLKPGADGPVSPWKLNAMPGSAWYHTPCHTRALWKHSPYLPLLKLIPELEVDSQDRGCSGMAGLFGLSQKNFDRSLAMGKDLIEASASGGYDFHVSECSSCKMQLEQQSTTRTFHPLKLLAYSAGLLDEWDPNNMSKANSMLLSR
ncbi:FAD-linked oxidase C-terminal domain-containing protein [Lacunimicrobium album]